MPDYKDIEVAKIEQLLIEAKLEERIRLAKLPHAALPSIFLNDEDVQRALKQEAGEGEHMKLEVYRKFLVWRVRFISKNGRTIMNSEAYSSKSNAQRALNIVKKEMR